MLKRIKAYMALPKGEKHYTRWFVMNYEKLYRLKLMKPHEAVILNDYTDQQIKEFGKDLLYVLTKDLSLTPQELPLLNTKNNTTIAQSVRRYNKWVDFKTIKRIIDEK